MVKNNLFRRIAVGFVLIFSIVTISCEQYEYDSPLPGILEVRLAVKNSRSNSILPFGVIDPVTQTETSFYLNLKKLEAFQSGDIRLPIYSSLAAIGRNVKGDLFNVLNVSGRDSNFVLGVAYAPPGEFVRFEVEIYPRIPAEVGSGEFPSPVLIALPGYQNPIFVIARQPVVDLQQLPEFGQQLVVPIVEGRTTRVVLTFDMDRSLIQLAETFEYVPYYYISSVTQF